MKLLQVPRESVGYVDARLRYSESDANRLRATYSPINSGVAANFTHFCSGRRFFIDLDESVNIRKKFLSFENPFAECFGRYFLQIDFTMCSNYNRTFVFTFLLREKERKHLVKSLQDSDLFIVESESDVKGAYTVIIMGSGANLCTYIFKLIKEFKKSAKKTEKPKTPFEIFFGED